MGNGIGEPRRHRRDERVTFDDVGTMPHQDEGEVPAVDSSAPVQT